MKLWVDDVRPAPNKEYFWSKSVYDAAIAIEEAEYLFYCSRCDCAFTAKASECGEDFMHCVTHECLECHSKLRAFGLPNRFRECD